MSSITLNFAETINVEGFYILHWEVNANAESLFPPCLK